MRITILGDKAGKTSIIQRWIGQPLIPENTIGIDMKTMVFRGTEPIVLHLWDCSGEKHYEQMYDNYIENSDIVVIVFDLTSSQSWMSAQYWITRTKISIDTPVFLIGNKLDLESTRQVKKREIKLFKRQIRRPYLFYSETSALTGENCKATLRMIVQEARQPPVYTQNDLTRNDRCTIV